MVYTEPWYSLHRCAQAANATVTVFLTQILAACKELVQLTKKISVSAGTGAPTVLHCVFVERLLHRRYCLGVTAAQLCILAMSLQWRMRGGAASPYVRCVL
jgi:hypothetical protein